MIRSLARSQLDNSQVQVKAWNQKQGEPTLEPAENDGWTCQWEGTDTSTVPSLRPTVDQDRQIIVYTDGGYVAESPQREPQGAWSFVAEGEPPYHADLEATARKENMQITIGNDTAELYALCKALEYVRDRLAHQRCDLVTIISDSTFAIQAAEGAFDPQNNHSLVKRTRKVRDDVLRSAVLQIQWTAAHTGTAGNELADLGATLSLAESTTNTTA